jgi:hypothetical protein
MKTWISSTPEPLYDLFLGKDHDVEHLDPSQAEEAFAVFLEEVRQAELVAASMSFADAFEHQREPFSLRMVHVHLIGEYARHNGDADLLRQALDGVVGR